MLTCFAERDGVISAAEEANLPVVGMMVDQKEEAPKNVVIALLWNVRPTVDAVTEQATWKPASEDLGTYSFMKEGGSDIALINTDIVGGVPDDLVKQVEDKKQQILDGSFTTPVDESAPKGSIDVSQQDSTRPPLEPERHHEAVCDLVANDAVSSRSRPARSRCSARTARASRP